MPHLGGFVVKEGIVIHLLINFCGLLCQKHRIIGVLDLGDHFQTAAAGLFHRQFHVLSADFQAFPELGIHQRHRGRYSGREGIPSAYFHSIVLVFGRFALTSRGSSARHYGRHIEIHVHHLFFDCPLESARSVYLREKGRISALFCILASFNFLIGNFYGYVFTQSYFQSLVETDKSLCQKE